MRTSVDEPARSGHYSGFLRPSPARTRQSEQMTHRSDVVAPEHPCPLCGRRVAHVPRHPRAVCDNCLGSARCEHDRPVTGQNTRFTAMGITVTHDDRTECVQAIGSGRVWVDGHECRIVTTIAGGVVVETPA